MRGRLALRGSAWWRAAAVGVLAALLCSAPALALPDPALLPDGRNWELVSPPDKHGASIQPLGLGIQGPLGGLVQASEDGTRLTYQASAPVEGEPEANRAPESAPGVEGPHDRSTGCRDRARSRCPRLLRHAHAPRPE